MSSQENNYTEYNHTGYNHTESLPGELRYFYRLLRLNFRTTEARKIKDLVLMFFSQYYSVDFTTVGEIRKYIDKLPMR